MGKVGGKSQLWVVFAFPAARLSVRLLLRRPVSLGRSRCSLIVAACQLGSWFLRHGRGGGHRSKSGVQHTSCLERSEHQVLSVWCWAIHPGIFWR